MTDRPPSERLAHQLLVAEGMRPQEAATAARACSEILEKLHGKLRPIVGNGGFETILGRAVILAARRHPSIAEVSVPRTGPPPVADLERIAADAPDRSVETFRSLLDELLSFGGRLIGWGFLLPLLRDLWPEATSGHDATTLREGSPRKNTHSGSKDG